MSLIRATYRVYLYLLLVCYLAMFISSSTVGPGENDLNTSVPSLGMSATSITLSLLSVEGQVAPIGLDVVPRFSWIIASNQNGDVQTSYHIKVSKTQNGNNAVWDSGVVTTKKSYLIEYGGPALSSDTHYFWTVAVATKFGSTTSSSEFTTGFLLQNDWGTSSWIGKPTSGTAPPSDLVAAFQNSTWIWTTETDSPNAPACTVAFRKTFAPPSGKVPTSVNILITADDQFSLFVDGNSAGQSPQTADIWKNAQYFESTLNSSSSHLFAVLATNLADVSTGGASPAGLLAAIQVHFSDGTSSTITADSSWIYTSSVVAGWNTPGGSTTGWSAAQVVNTYGAGPWGSQVIIPDTISSSDLTFDNSFWIWSAESDPPNAPPGQRAFRKTFTAPSGKILQSASVIITVDDQFAFYVNGQLVGESPNETDAWKSGQRFTAPLSGTSAVFAVNATNLPDVNSGGASPAGLLATIRITFNDGSSQTVVSDTTWKVSNTVPTGFQSPAFSDSSWPSAASQGAFGVAPWNKDATIADSLGEHPAPLLRKEFNINKTLSSARLYYSAGGYAHITINGAPASDRVLTPGFTKYDTTMLYVALDVKSLLRSGANAIGAELGRSHYGSTQGSVWNWNTASWHGEPRVRMVLSLAFSDGTAQRVVTDGSWKTKEGPTRLDDLFGGENYDASYFQHGYDLPGFDASSWTSAAVMPAPGGSLVNQLQPPTRITESITPVNITEPVPGIFVAAFERVVSGWVKLTATGPAKTLITIHFGEKLHDDGTVFYEDFQHYYQNNFQTDRFWLTGTGKPESFEPKFSYKGYLYVQIEGWPGSNPPTPQDITGRVVHDDLATHGGFQTSNDLLNKLHEASVNTLLNNVHSIPTDCPTYEKNGWSGDAMLSTEMALFNLDSANLLAKYVRDLDQSRLYSTNGSGPPGVIAPDDGWGSNNHSPTWHSAFIFIPWWLYYYRGDARVLQEHYDSMKNYVEFELGRSPNNIASTDLGDWVSPETSPLGGNPPEDLRVSATAYLYQMLTVMNQVATVLNKSADGTTFASQAANVKIAFNNAFLNSTTGYYTGVGDSGYRQTHNLLALGFDLVPPASVSNVSNSIAADIATKGTHLNTGCLGTKYILPMLTEHGHIDTAFAVSTQTTFPSWGFWIANGATSMWEHWAVDARSHDHHFLGTFEDWLFKHVAGIKPTSPGFETVTISPLLTSQLSSASAWTMTPFGNLSVQWSAVNDSVSVKLSIPVGVNATFSIPGRSVSPLVFGSGTHSFNG